MHFDSLWLVGVVEAHPDVTLGDTLEKFLVDADIDVRVARRLVNWDLPDSGPKLVMKVKKW